MGIFYSNDAGGNSGSGDSCCGVESEREFVDLSLALSLIRLFSNFANWTVSTRQSSHCTTHFTIHFEDALFYSYFIDIHLYISFVARGRLLF
jgi:hypothetical protein